MDLSVDTSVIMAVILNEPSKPFLLDRTRDAELQSPPTLPWEVGNGLSALFKRDRISLGQAKAALESYRRIPIRLAEVDLEVAVTLAKDHGIYAYDAYVLECALRYRTPLLSLDHAQCEVARKLGIDVIEVAA